VDWAHSLTRQETGPEPVWLREFASMYLRARRYLSLKENSSMDELTLDDLVKWHAAQARVSGDRFASCQ
jgi:hypothetical protein